MRRVNDPVAGGDFTADDHTARTGGDLVVGEQDLEAGRHPGGVSHRNPLARCTGSLDL